MSDKDKIFEKLIWNAYSQSENFDRLSYQLHRIKKIMSSHRSFRELSSRNQFAHCITIGIIVSQSTIKDLRQLSLSGDKEQVFEYSINEGYTEPSPIKIQKTRLLENK